MCRNVQDRRSRSVSSCDVTTFHGQVAGIRDGGRRRGATALSSSTHVGRPSPDALMSE